MSNYFIYAALGGFLFGVAVGTLTLPQWSVGWWLLLLTVALVVVGWRAGFARAPVAVFIVCGCLFGLTLGYGRLLVPTSFSEVSPLAAQIGSPVTITGTVVREPDVRERTQHLVVRTKDTNVLVFTDRYTTYRYGDTLLVSGTLTEPEAFTTDLGRTFNYPDYLKAQGISYLIRYGQVEVKETRQGNRLVQSLLSLKAGFMLQLEQTIPEPSVGLGEGLLLGVKQALGDDLEEAFRATGIIHIVVLSGYNISLVVVFVMVVLGFLLPWRARLVVGAMAIIAFALIVGFSATVLRASLMALFILLAQATGRTYDVLRGLVVAGVLMLVWNPYLLLFDVGFQLSFVATAGLILFSPLISPSLTFMPTRFGLREFLAATLATQLAVLPILLYQMGEVSLVAVIVNLLVLPMVPLAMLLTFLTGVVSVASQLAALVIGYLATGSLTYIITVAERFAGLPFAAVMVPAFSVWLVPVLYALIIVVYWWLRRLRTSPARSFASWTIVPEAEFVASLKPKPTPQTPVFFR